jgi:hypothetical protein
MGLEFRRRFWYRVPDRMSVQSEFISNDGYLVVKLRGLIGHEWVGGAAADFERWALHMGAGNARRLLIDIRGERVDLSIGDRYDLAVEYAKSSLARLQVGVLGDAPQATTERFFETVAQNRGASIFVFFTEAEAVAWAKGGDAPAAGP